MSKMKEYLEALKDTPKLIREYATELRQENPDIKEHELVMRLAVACGKSTRTIYRVLNLTK